MSELILLINLLVILLAFSPGILPAIVWFKSAVISKLPSDLALLCQISRFLTYCVVFALLVNGAERLFPLKMRAYGAGGYLAIILVSAAIPCAVSWHVVSFVGWMHRRWPRAAKLGLALSALVAFWFVCATS